MQRHLRLIDKLWTTGRLAATRQLKTSQDFWFELARPLSDTEREEGKQREREGAFYAPVSSLSP